MTVGELKKLIEQLPDSTPFVIREEEYNDDGEMVWADVDFAHPQISTVAELSKAYDTTCLEVSQDDKVLYV